MFMTVKQAAEKWGISGRIIRVLCSKGRIPGAYQEGRGWKISIDADKPADGQYKSKENVPISENIIKQIHLAMENLFAGYVNSRLDTYLKMLQIQLLYE